MKPIKAPNLHDIAKLARTSKSTVSRVISGQPHVSAAVRKRVEDAIRLRGFHPNLSARRLAGGKAGVVAVVMPWLESGFFAEVMRGIIEVTWLEHRDHLLTSFALDADDFIRHWRNVAFGNQVDGVVLVTPPPGVLKENAGDFPVPVVLCACKPPATAVGWRNMDTVTVDNASGMESLLKFLRAAGHRHLVHFAANPDSHDGKERLQAFRVFLKKHPEMKGEFLTGEPKREGGRNLLESYLFQHVGRLPDSFVCFNDAMAMGVLHRMKEKGLALRNPHQVTGCDDDVYSQYVGLTTLRMPMVRIGQEAAHLVYERLATKDEKSPARPRHVVLDLPLMTRGLQQLP